MSPLTCSDSNRKPNTKSVFTTKKNSRLKNWGDGVTCTVRISKRYFRLPDRRTKEWYAKQAQIWCTTRYEQRRLANETEYARPCNPNVTWMSKYVPMIFRCRHGQAASIEEVALFKINCAQKTEYKKEFTTSCGCVSDQQCTSIWFSD